MNDKAIAVALSRGKWLALCEVLEQLHGHTLAHIRSEILGQIGTQATARTTHCYRCKDTGVEVLLDAHGEPVRRFACTKCGGPRNG